MAPTPDSRLSRFVANIAVLTTAVVLVVCTLTLAWEVTVSGSEIALQTLDKFGYLALGALISLVGNRFGSPKQ